ncbi:toxin-antitoxin system, toxin component, PIN family protein, partial [Rhizobium pusense]|nr:toxin-antitoxin system, toxin component, PIN family protein [Agrobacterium pusense]MDH1115942.1 toxin-antitoxin system, toxin component, PIN family protein [Agrobacterium pusense]
DWDLMPRIVAEDYTFVTNNARDFRKLYGRQDVHAGLIIIVPQVVPALQRDLFELILQEIAGGEELLNEVIEISIEDDEAVLTRYSLPTT